MVDGNIKITNRGMGWDFLSPSQLKEMSKIKIIRTFEKYNRGTLTILITKPIIEK